MKKIVFIPPNGYLHAHDFSIKRIAKYLKTDGNFITVLIKIDKFMHDEQEQNVDRTIIVQNKEELFNTIKDEKPDYIFHRSWMHMYPFAADLVKEFQNVIINIKDWNFSTKQAYEIVFSQKEVEDFKAIEYIFKNAKIILSHYTDEEAVIWAKEYNVDKEKFIFFPEYCNHDKFYFREDIYYKNPKIVYAGTMCPTSFTEEHFPCKAYLRSIRKLTKDKIDITYVLVKSAYDAIQDEKRRILFLDIIYEDKFNNYFHIKQGKIHDSSILKEYHFGFFHLEDTMENQRLTRYAVPSKFAFYLESGLPILINSNMKAISQIVKDNALGIVFSNEELDSLAYKLKAITQEEYKFFVKNIEVYRNNFTYENNLSKVLELF